MPIKFISLSETFTEKIKQYGYEAYTMKIQEYKCPSNKKTYFISPANSLCFMDGGIDYALSRIIFPGTEPQIKNIVKQIGIQNIVGKYYLPIGSSIIIDDDKNNKSLCISPTMLLPQNVSKTNNAYIATMAILHNILINKGEHLENVDIILTSLCCGYGKMTEDESIEQILKGINDYVNYVPNYILSKNIIINEPNLFQQPKYYQNTEWFQIAPNEIINC